MTSYERASTICAGKQTGKLLAMISDSDNDTPALNALKALRGALISMSRGEIPVELLPAATCFCHISLKFAKTGGIFNEQNRLNH